jgi:hypothetical protein
MRPSTTPSVVVCMFRIFVLSITAALAAACGVVVSATPAHACSCAPASEAEFFRLADVVFTGTLIDRKEPPWRPVRSTTDPATLTFEVSRVHKGEAERLQEVETAMSGASCGLEIEGSGPFLVFANHARDGATQTASLCGGTRAIADGGPSEFGSSHLPESDVEGRASSWADAGLAVMMGSGIAVVLALVGWLR